MKLGAGNQVELVPLTPYIKERLERATIRNENITPRDNRVEKYQRTTLADAQGHFEFKNIPAGEYYVTAKVTWEAPTGYQGALQTQGGFISKKIKVTDREEIEVILTR